MERRLHQFAGKRNGPTSTRRPVSSWNSRARLVAASSPNSTPPPGGAQKIPVRETPVVDHHEPVADDTNTARPHPNTISVQLFDRIFHSGTFFDRKV